MLLKQWGKQTRGWFISEEKKQKKNKTVLQKWTVFQMKLKLEGKWFE